MVDGWGSISSKMYSERQDVIRKMACNAVATKGVIKYGFTEKRTSIH